LREYALFQSLLDLVECRPAGILERDLALTRIVVQVLATVRAQPLAIFVAEGPERHGEQNLLAKYVLQKNTVTLIIPNLGLGFRDRDFVGFAISSERAVKQVELPGNVEANWLQTTGTRNLYTGRELTHESDVLHYLMLAVPFFDEFGAT